ncbi:MAG TPA: hypothetical protein VIP29_01645 [Nitrososphaeraceae archaeon]
MTRDIYEIPFEMPIPRYDSSAKFHDEIATLSEASTNKVKDSPRKL